MSLLAGYDIVLEFSHELLLKLIKSNMKIGGVPVSPPFELDVPFSAPGLAAGAAHVIVNDLDVFVNAGDALTIHLPFYDSSFSAGPVTVSPLDGTIVISGVPISMVTGNTQSTKAIAIDLGAPSCNADIVFGNASMATISTILAPLQITADMFKGIAVKALTDYVHALSLQQFPLAYQVIPGQNGSFSPLQFESLEIHCIPQSQIICLFGILDAGRHGAGSFGDKTSAAIAAGNNFSISIGPDAFHRFCFVPAVATQMGVDPSQLPPTCGPASSINTSGVTISRIADQFDYGHVDIDGTMSKSGTCYEAHGNFHAELTLGLQGNKLTPSVVVDDPSIDVDIPWYCWLAAAVAGPFFLVATGVLQGIAGNIANGIAKSALNGALTQGFAPVAIGGIQDISFSTVGITAEGITINGNGNVYLPIPSTQDLDLIGSVVTLKKAEITSGTFHSTAMGAVGDYQYTEYAQEQVATYQILPTLLGRPLKLECWISDPLHSNKQVQLPIGTSTIALQDMKCEYDMPLPSGTTVTQDIHLSCTVTQQFIELKNVSSEGDFAVLLHAKATDPIGNMQEDSVLVQFDGNSVDCPQFWEDRDKFFSWLRQILLGKKMMVRRKPPFPPIDRPGPEVIHEYVQQLFEYNTPEADAALAISKMLHSASFRHAIAQTGADMVKTAPPHVGTYVEKLESDRILHAKVA